MSSFDVIFDHNEYRVWYDYERHKYLYQDVAINEFRELELVATLHYDINAEPLWSVNLDTLFDNTCCGEQVTDDEIIYWWFKEI